MILLKNMPNPLHYTANYFFNKTLYMSTLFTLQIDFDDICTLLLCPLHPTPPHRTEPKGRRRYIVLGADPVGVRVASFSALHIRGYERIRFW